MKGKRRCVHCRKIFEWDRSDTQIEQRKSLPRFCGHKCRLDHGGTGFRPGGEKRISELSEKEKLENRKKSFEKSVIRKEGCWEWKDGISASGYTQMSLNIQYGNTSGHRSSWIIHNGPIPKGKQVCHTCDNRTCTNPDHLWLGTAKENAADRENKGRSNNILPPRKKGSENGNSKLNEESVKEIKVLLMNGKSLSEIGIKFHVSKQTISRIKNGVIWKHI